MLFAYKIITQSYFLSIKIASLFNKKAKFMIQGRKKWREELKSKIDKKSKYIWFHCASLGEFEQGRPLLEKIKTEKPQYKIILSFFSPSGYQARKDYQFADIVCYLPFDSAQNAKEFIEITNPSLVIFVKYEIWYYFLERLNKNKIPTYLISAIFRPNQVFFKFYGKTYRKALGFFDKIFLQTEESQNLLKKYNFNNTLVCGDTRIDRVVDIAKEDYNNPIFKKFCKDKTCFVFGSTWEADEKLISNFINTSAKEYVFIIAPHEITEGKLRNIEQNFKIESQRLSKIEKLNPSTRLIIIDSIGLLSKLYRYAIIAYVGGGFGKGIHNILEAVVYEIPVIFGPNYKKFNEATELIANQVGFSVNTSKDYENIMNLLISGGNIYRNCQINAKQYISASFGSTHKIFNNLLFL
ncbi:MAG: 3-deoxy-D-manno-octulosonic acid transferase [Bacteroidales bacterium]|mgnify:CR=1 FL=1|jgi:3-deoxy-D-manno-octulosonic-acid transferase|nr:3-deoxy-D-manno-octulosonic acid transferase [Bacteroidales bacterium]MCK9499086.1 3-deoxy-D-manno-octulosonic acid transferase [Bacteroidales bacterium]MDY0315763.1 glycosyltransferase N-terminal domain-containing protein [Bacteroidales bacterium]